MIKLRPHLYFYGQIILYLSILLFLLAFKVASNKAYDQMNDMDFSSIELIDTFTNVLSPLQQTKQSTAAFYPMYIGTYTPQIPLFYSSNALDHHRTRDWYAYNTPDSSTLQLFVDTSKIIGSVQLLTIPILPTVETTEATDEPQYTRGNIRSYPLFILNQSTTTVEMGLGEYLPLLIEAKDSTGHWKPIQKAYYHHCGTGLTNFYLPPNEFVLSSCPIFEGDFTTTLRVKHIWSKGNYSNEFQSNINYSQFQEEENVWSY